MRIGERLNRAKEAVGTRVHNGMERLKGVAQRVGLETAAEVAIVSQPIIDGVREVRDGVGRAWDEQDGNVLRKFVHVVAEGGRNLGDRLGQMGTAAREGIKDLGGRYADLGVVGTPVRMVEDAVRAVVDLPARINERMARFEGGKREIMGLLAEGAGLNEASLAVVRGVVDHVEVRRDNFERRAAVHRERVQRIGEGVRRLLFGRQRPSTVGA